MKIQTVFKAGNSHVVAIPKDLSKELDIKSGQKVIVDKSPDGEAIVIRKKTRSKTRKSASKAEFNKWLKEVLKEDAEILDELAVR